MAGIGWAIGDVEVEVVVDHVARVTMNRPPDNPLETDQIAALAEVLERLDDTPACRAIVLAAAGKHFCAGAVFASGASGPTHGGRGHVYDEAVRLFTTRKPIVAAVRGAAIGGGLGLALAADFRIGTPSTRMAANFARLGFHHGFGLTVTLPQVVGPQRALGLLYTGRRLTGQEALNLGLLDALVDDNELDDAAHRYAVEIAKSAPLAVESIRQTMRGDLAGRVRAAMAHERDEQDRLRRTADFAEGVRSYAQRRDANFEGR